MQVLDPEEVEKNVLEQAVTISKQTTPEFQQRPRVTDKSFVVKMLCTVTLPATTLKTLNTLDRDTKDRLSKLQSSADDSYLTRTRLRLRQQLLQIAIREKEEALTKKRLAWMAKKESRKRERAALQKEEGNRKEPKMADARWETKPVASSSNDSSDDRHMEDTSKPAKASHHESDDSQRESAILSREKLLRPQQENGTHSTPPSSSSAPTPSEASCPICGTSFPTSMSLRDRTRHVDHCIAITNAPSPAPTTPLSERIDVRNSHSKRRFIDDGDRSFHRSLLVSYLQWREAERSTLPSASLRSAFEEQAATLNEWTPRDLPAGIDLDAMLDQYYREEPAVRLTRWFALPRHLFAGLYGYQREGVSWLLKRHWEESGGIVADEMGLGKTLQVLALLLGMVFSREARRRGRDWEMIPMMDDGGEVVETDQEREESATETSQRRVEVDDDDDHRAPDVNESQLPSLLVVPATLVGHWLREVHRWCPLLRCVLAHGMGETMSGGATPAAILRQCRKNHRYDLVMTTYEAFRSQKCFAGIPWFYAVLDEGGRIKNAKVGVSRKCRLLQTRHRLLISGTPLQNNLKELWSLMDFVFPGKLGTEETFVRSFVQPINRGIYANASLQASQLGYQMSLVLQDTISPYILRRLKRVGFVCCSHEGRAERIAAKNGTSVGLFVNSAAGEALHRVSPRGTGASGAGGSRDAV